MRILGAARSGKGENTVVLSGSLCYTQIISDSGLVGTNTGGIPVEKVSADSSPDTGQKKGDPARSQASGMDIERFWSLLVSHQGETFYTAKKLPFTYRIRGGEVFVDRRSKSITRATMENALKKLAADEQHLITGPKALCCFGAPYIWALIKAFEPKD